MKPEIMAANIDEKESVDNSNEETADNRDGEKESDGSLTISAEHAKQSLFKGLGEHEKNIIGRVIYAGNKMLFGSKEMTDMVVAGIQRQDDMDISDKLGIGVGHTLIEMYNVSKGTMPIGALLPAGYVLLAKMFEFVNEAGLAKATDDDFGEALQMMNAVINKVFNKDFNGDLVAKGKAALEQGQQTQSQSQSGQHAAQSQAMQQQPDQPVGLIGQGA